MADDLDFVLGQLADESIAVRLINLIRLSDVPRSQTGRFRVAWAGLSAIRRNELVSAMVEQAEANIHLNFHTILRECLRDDDPQVRQTTIEGLWEDERISLVNPLVAMLSSDPVAEVRAAAATSLGRFVLLGVLGEISESVAGQAIEALRTAWLRPQETTGVRRRALEGLAYLNEPDVHALIDNAYYDESDLMRQSAVFAMGRNADRRWARYIMEELTSQDAPMRFEAASAAGELGFKGAVKPLIQLLDDTDSNIREAAAMALGKIGGKEAQRALEACRRGDDERLVDAASEALAELTFNSDSFDDSQLDHQPDSELEWDELSESRNDDDVDFADDLENESFDGDSEADLFDEDDGLHFDAEDEEGIEAEQDDDWDEDL